MSGGLFVHALLRETGRTLSADDIARLQQAHAVEYRKQLGSVTALPGARELLAALTGAGVRWAIATSGYAAHRAARPRAPRAPRGHPDGDPGYLVRHAKPDPDLFLAAAALLGVEPQHAMVVGDSVWDLLAARRAGSLGIGLQSGGYGREELERRRLPRLRRPGRDALAPRRDRRPPRRQRGRVTAAAIAADRCGCFAPVIQLTGPKAAVTGSPLLNVRMLAGRHCMSEDAAELTAELVVDGAMPSQPVISSDGCWVAYVVAPVGRKEERHLSTLWVAAVDGSSPPRKLTTGTAADSDPRWAPDSASVFFLSDSAGSRQLHRIRPGGGEAEVLTDWHGEISDARPLADAGLVAVVATDEPTEEDKRRRAERDDAFVWGQQLPPARLRLLDLATGELRTVDGLGDRHVVELAARPDGRALAAISWADPDNDPGATTGELHVIDLETGTARGLGRIGTEARSPAWWQADGDWHLAYLAMPEPFGGDAVYDVVACADAAVHRDLTAGMTVCPTELAQFGDGPPLALFADGLDTAIYQFDPRLGRFERVAARDGLVDSLTASRSGEVIAALASTSYEPMNVHAGPPERPAHPAQRHPAGVARGQLGDSGTPVLSGSGRPRPRRPARLAARPQPRGRPVPADHVGTRRP